MATTPWLPNVTTMLPNITNITTSPQFTISPMSFLELVPQSVVYCTSIACSLSIVGALIIFTAYFFVPSEKTKTRSLLTFLTVADLMNASGILTGTIRYSVNYRHTNETIIDASEVCRMEVKDEICIIQSYITTYATLASFCWTITIGISLILLAVYRSDVCFKFWMKTFAHVACWGCPMAIVIAAGSYNVLGDNFAQGTASWCWIKSCGMRRSERTMWMLITGKGWELFTYLTNAVLYILLKIYIYREGKRQNKRMGFREMYHRLRNEDEYFVFMWIIIYVQRVWGTARFFLSLSDSYIGTSDLVLMHMQGIGDSSQAFFNCLLFVFLDKPIRRGLWQVLQRRYNPEVAEDLGSLAVNE